MAAGDTSESMAGLGSGLDDVHIEDATVEDDNDLAIKGITLLLNNQWTESRELFEQYKSQSAIMHYGGAFVAYVQGRLHVGSDCIAFIQPLDAALHALIGTSIDAKTHRLLLQLAFWLMT